MSNKLVLVSMEKMMQVQAHKGQMQSLQACVGWSVTVSAPDKTVVIVSGVAREQTKETKLQNKFLGPYEVAQSCSNHTYEIERQVHVSVFQALPGKIRTSTRIKRT